MGKHSIPTTWSPQQETALATVKLWLKNKDKQVFRLFGYAGTGKTTLAKTIASDVKGIVIFGAFTGKAAQVLRQKGCDGASTIHSMIYKPKQDQNGVVRFVLDRNGGIKDANLIIIDECSMVDEALAKDLMSFKKPILVLGDPAQLPPVKGTGFFTDVAPDFMLTEIHRQASDNPIIALSAKIRLGEKIQRGDYGAVSVIGRDDFGVADVMAADQLLCGLNRTRETWNRRVREHLGRADQFPVIGDRVVCLKNNRDSGLFNGGIWNAVKVGKVIDNGDLSSQIIQVKSDDFDVVKKCSVLEKCWSGGINDLPWAIKKDYDEFTYGYALTVHKSQGSQWNNVFLIDEAFIFKDDAARHRYTAVTRAAEKITIAI